MPASGHVQLRQRARGAQFYVKYRAGGRQVQKRLGPAWEGGGRPPAGYFTRKAAEAALRAILTDADRGTLAVSARPGDKTFGDACAEWLRYIEHDRQRAVSTVRSYNTVVNGRLIPRFGEDTALASITTEVVDAYRERLLGEGKLSRSTIRGDMLLLHGIFKRAARRKWITTNPSEHAERVSVARSGDFNVLSVEDVEACARKVAAPQLAALIRVAAYTGLRLGELRALRWADVAFSNATIHVRRNLPTGGEEKTPKSEKVRSVPLIDQAARALDGLSRRDVYTAPADRVFISPTGGAVDPGEIREGFYAALKAAGLGRLREQDNPIVLHDLRHTFGTLAVQVWPLHDVQGYMGHADITTTMIYVHHVPKTNAADQFSTFVAKQMGEEPCPEPCPEPSSSRAPERNSANLSAPA